MLGAHGDNPPDTQGCDFESEAYRSKTQQQVFLKPDTKIEPLSCGWYAWMHLISPLQHALNLAFRQIPLLESFVKNPEVHLAAVSDPKLFGGPFVHLTRDQVSAAQLLLEGMKNRHAKLIDLARDMRQLDRTLQESASGYSLSEFYTRLPESLSGLVEFLYDTNDHPKLRIREELLYDENPGAGAQEVLISAVKERDRPFFMTTPRLQGPDEILLQMSFSDRRLDRLSRMRTASARLDQVADELRIPEQQRAIFGNFFTTTAPAREAPEYHGDHVRVRYFGHACVLIQSRKTSILIDPMLAFDDDRLDDRYIFCDLPDHLHYVVLSHNHQDHCNPEMLIQLRHRIGRVIVPAGNSGNIADPSLKLALASLGFRDIDVLNTFDTVEFADGRITSLPFPGEHVDLDVHSRHGIHLEIAGRRIAFLVDSDACDSRLFNRVARRIGKTLDALFIGMECHGAPLSWLYGPLRTKPIGRRNDESRRLSGMDCAQAWKVVQEFDAARVFVYAMGQEPWLRYIMGLEYSADSIQLKEVARFLGLCSGSGIAAEHLFISKEMEF